MNDNFFVRIFSIEKYYNMNQEEIIKLKEAISVIKNVLYPRYGENTSLGTILRSAERRIDYLKKENLI